MSTTHHSQVMQNTMAMHNVCSTADDQPVHDNNTPAFAGSQHVDWQSDTIPSCHTGRHRHGMHSISHRDTSSAYTDSYLPLTMKLVNSFVIPKLVFPFLNCQHLLLCLNMSIMPLLSAFPLAMYLCSGGSGMFNTHILVGNNSTQWYLYQKGTGTRSCLAS